MVTATVTSKGQITIPVEVRRKLGLHAGDRVIFVEHDDGEITLKAKKINLMDLAGSLKWTGKPATIEEMNEAVGRYLGEDDERIKREYAELIARGGQ